MKKTNNSKLPYFSLKKKVKVDGQKDSKYDQLKQTAQRLLMQNNSTKESLNQNKIHLVECQKQLKNLNSALNELVENKTKFEAQIENCETIHGNLKDQLSNISKINEEAKISLQNYQKLVSDGYQNLNISKIGREKRYEILFIMENAQELKSKEQLELLQKKQKVNEKLTENDLRIQHLEKEISNFTMEEMKVLQRIDDTKNEMKEIDKEIDCLKGKNFEISNTISETKDAMSSEKKDFSQPKNQLNLKLKEIGVENEKFQEMIEQPFFKNKFDLDDFLFQELLKFVEVSQYKDIIQRIDSVTKEINIESNKIEHNNTIIYGEGNKSKSICELIKNKQDKLEEINQEKLTFQQELDEKSNVVESTQKICNSKISIKEKSKNQISEMISQIESVKHDIESNKLKLKEIDSMKNSMNSLISILENKMDFLNTMKDEDEGFTFELKKLSEEEYSFHEKQSNLNDTVSKLIDTISSFESNPNKSDDIQIKSLTDDLDSKIKLFDNLVEQTSQIELPTKRHENLDIQLELYEESLQINFEKTIENERESLMSKLENFKHSNVQQHKQPKSLLSSFENTKPIQRVDKTPKVVSSKGKKRFIQNKENSDDLFDELFNE
eukprot:gene2373-2838_t